MKNKFYPVFALLIVFTLLLAACAPAATATPTPAETKLKLAAIFPGVISDSDYNTLGYLGAEAVQKDMGVEMAYSESVPVPDIDRVMREVGQRPETATASPQPARAPSGYGSPPPQVSSGQDGVYPSLDEAVAAAGLAFRRLNALPLAIREDMVAHMRQAARENALLLAEIAVSETGMGRVEDKNLKNILNANKAPGTEALPTEAWSGDGG